MIAIRNFFRHLRDGMRNLFRNGWMTTASIFTMALTLFIVGGLILFLANIEKITNDIESSIQVRVMIDLTATRAEEIKLENDIKKLEHVVNVTYRTKDEELQALIENVGEEFKLHEGDDNPLLNVLVVDVDNSENMAEVTEKIKTLNFVQAANYGELMAEDLFGKIDFLRYLLAIIAAILIVIAVLLISTTIRTTIFARQTEIEIMRLVGAKNSFIRAPFSIEGALIGIIGSAIASGGLWGLYEMMIRIPGQVYGIMNLKFLPSNPYIYIIAGALCIIGIFLGVLGARKSMRQFLKL